MKYLCLLIHAYMDGSFVLRGSRVTKDYGQNYGVKQFPGVSSNYSVSFGHQYQA